MNKYVFLFMMDISPAEFNEKFQDTVDNILVALAEHEEVNPEKFYSMACMLENLAFFSPVIYGVLQQKKGKQE